MPSLRIECLGCGETRVMQASLLRLHDGECPRCAYVGWAPSSDLNEPQRRALRERPLAQRRLRLVV